MTQTRWRLVGAGLASAYTLHYALTYRDWHFIDNVNLIFHEAGHTIFFFLGDFVQVLMGSGFQVLLPSSIALYFFFIREERLSAAVCLMWAGMSMLNLIRHTNTIATTLSTLGFIISCIGVSLAIYTACIDKNQDASII